MKTLEQAIYDAVPGGLKAVAAYREEHPDLSEMAVKASIYKEEVLDFGAE